MKILAAMISAAAVAASFALNTGISEAELRKSIVELASDKFQGRLTGSEGGAATESYLEERFSSLNLDKICEPGGFRQSFSFTAGVKIGEGNSVVFVSGGKALCYLSPEKDFMPASFSEDCEINGAAIVFAGFGIRSKEPARNDYDGIDAKNKVVIVLRDGPEGDDPKSVWAPYQSSRYKASVAKELGARALVVVSASEKGDELPAMKRGAAAGSSQIPVFSMKRRFLKKLMETEKRPMPEAGRADGTKAFQLERSTADIRIILSRERENASNIVGFLPATVKTADTIVVGAHWDHLGRGIEGSLAAKFGEIHRGADDNASGTAGVLELARIFTLEKNRAKNLLFVCFAGEEIGALGSGHFVKNIPPGAGNIVAMINLDMIGRLREKVIVDGTGTAKEWKDLLERANTEKLQLSTHEDGYGASDHSSFYAKNIPVLFFFTGAHSDYHLPSDTAEKIDCAGEAKILRLVENTILEIMNMEGRPTYAATEGNGGKGRASFNVYVGTVPDFTEEGKGFKIMSVRPGSPAEKAGLKGGDLLVSLGGKKIGNIYDYTYALQEFRPGEEAEAVVIRDGAEVKVKIVFGARKAAE